MVFLSKIMKTTAVLRILVLTLLLELPAAWAETATAPCSGDTWIFFDDPVNNMGAATDFAAGVNAIGSPMRAFLRFDVSAIPANATITAAALNLVSVKKNDTAPDATFVLHRMVKNWGEGRGSGQTGSTALSGEATWNARIEGGANWSSPGAAAPGDYSAATSASVLVTEVGLYTFSSTAGLVADVQNWVNNPANNFGWICQAQSESASTTARRWASRESGANAPSLLIHYTLPTAAQPPTLSAAVRTNGEFRFSFNAEANQAYTVETRATLATNGTWATLTNISASVSATNLVVTDSLASSNRFYRVKTP